MSLAINQGKFSLEQKLEMFDKFNDGIVDINGIPHIKIIRYDSQGFKSHRQSQHKFWEYKNETIGWDWGEHDGETNGCFAFCRFEDKWALTGVENEFTIRHITYLPLDTEVFIRNGIDKDSPEHLLVIEEDNEKLDCFSFVKLPISRMLERMKSMEDYVNSYSSRDLKNNKAYKKDGLSHSRYCNFKACEIVIPKDVIETINNELPIFVFPNENLFLETEMSVNKIIYEIFNKVIIPVMEENNCILQMSPHLNTIMIYKGQEENLHFKLKRNKVVLSKAISGGSFMKSKAFYELIGDIVVSFKKNNYEVELSENFYITDLDNSDAFDNNSEDKIEYDLTPFLNYGELNKPLLDNIKKMLETSNNINHKQAVLLALKKCELDYIGMYPRN